MSHLQASYSQDDQTFQYPYYPHQDSGFLYTQSNSTITHHCISTIKGNNSYISSIAINGNLLYTGSSNKEIRIWKKVHQEYVCDSVVIAGEGAIKSLVVSVSSNKIFTAHQDHKIRVFKLEGQGQGQNRNLTLTHVATLPTFSDRALTVCLPKNHVKVRRHKTSTWVHHVDTVSALALSRDGLVIYSVSWDRTLKIWRTSDFKCLESVPNAHDDAINTVVLSSNGDVYTGSTDTKVKIWRKPLQNQNHFLVATLKKHKSGVNALALSVNENVLYSGGSDRCVVVWEKTGEGNMVIVSVLKGHSRAVLCVSAVADFVCSGSEDETIRIWRGVEKCYFCLAVLEGHNGPVKCLASEIDECSSSDTSASYLIYSGSLDSDIKVWRIFIPIC